MSLSKKVTRRFNVSNDSKKATCCYIFYGDKFYFSSLVKVNVLLNSEEDYERYSYDRKEKDKSYSLNLS